MNTAQVLLKQATVNSIQCAKDYRGREEDFLIGSLRSQIRTLCNELDQFKAIEIRVGLAYLETLFNDYAHELNDDQQDAAGSVLAMVERHAGGPAAIQSALWEYESDPGILSDPDVCQHCDGSGMGKVRPVCDSCKGSGVLK